MASSDLPPLLPIVRSVELTPAPPYDFALALRYITTSPSAILEQVSADGVYRRALRLAGCEVVLALRSLGSVEQPRLLLELHAEMPLDERTEAAAIAAVRHIFTLDSDPTAFFALAERDPIFGRLIERFYGVRPVLIPDPFEALIWAVIGQQINVAFARKLKLVLIELCGRHVHTDAGDFALSPAPAEIAALDFDLLRTRQFSRQKAAYVLELSRVVAAGELDLASLAALPHEEALAAIMRFKGAGRWTAEYVLMRGLGASDSLPAGDIGLRAIIGRWYGLDRHSSENEVRIIAENWAGWRGWAAFCWWFALQSKLLYPPA